MIKIDIDQKLYSFLQENAIPYVETPNDTLKRLLNIIGKPELSQDKIESRDMLLFDKNHGMVSSSKRRSFLTKDSMKYSSKVKYHTVRTKRERTDLGVLVEERLLVEGQILFMTNYKGEIIKDEFATIKGGKLLYKYKEYSMSRLAKEILIKNDYSPSAIRGPKMWKTEEGVTIMELWLQHLKNRNRIH